MTVKLGAMVPISLEKKGMAISGTSTLVSCQVTRPQVIDQHGSKDGSGCRTRYRKDV